MGCAAGSDSVSAVSPSERRLEMRKLLRVSNSEDTLRQTSVRLAVREEKPLPVIVSSATLLLRVLLIIISSILICVSSLSLSLSRCASIFSLFIRLFLPFSPLALSRVLIGWRRLSAHRLRFLFHYPTSQCAIIPMSACFFPFSLSVSHALRSVEICRYGVASGRSAPFDLDDDHISMLSIIEPMGNEREDVDRSSCTCSSAIQWA